MRLLSPLSKAKRSLRKQVRESEGNFLKEARFVSAQSQTRNNSKANVSKRSQGRSRTLKNWTAFYYRKNFEMTLVV